MSAVRHAVCNVARRYVEDLPTLDAIALATTEACTNAVLHAYRDDATPGDVHVTVECDNGDIEIVVSDDGDGMRPRADSPGVGMGLAIIASLTSRCDLGGDGDGTRICMRFGRAG